MYVTKLALAIGTEVSKANFFEKKNLYQFIVQIFSSMENRPKTFGRILVKNKVKNLKLGLLFCCVENQVVTFFTLEDIKPPYERTKVSKVISEKGT